MANEIAKLYASLGFKVSDKGLREFQGKLEQTKDQIASSGGLTGATKKAETAQEKFFNQVKSSYTSKVKPNLQQMKRDLKDLDKIFSENAISQEEYSKYRSRIIEQIGKVEKQKEAAHQRAIEETRREESRQAKAREREHSSRIKNIFRINKQYDARSAKLKQLRTDFAQINREYKAGNITLMERERILKGIVAQRARLMGPDPAPGPYAGGKDPRQKGTHGLISALHSDAAIASLFGGFAAAGSVRSFQQFQAMQQGLTMAHGDMQQGQEAMEYLIQLSRKLGVFVGDLGSSFASFSAAAKGSSLTNEDIRNTFEGVSAQIRVLNLSAADAQGVFRSLTQMMN